MKHTYLNLSILAALAGLLPHCRADSLGTAADFAVLGNTVTSTGYTVLNGDLGTAPGTAISGFGPGTVSGTTYAGGTVAQQAENDALSDYNTLLGLTPTQSLTGQDLGGLTLTPGVYDFSSSAQLTGTLTLNAEGNPNAQFVFQIGSTLTTATASSVILENDASPYLVSWDVGSSATVGTGTSFAGNILANASITMNSGASLSGSAVALTGAVTLNDNAITADSLPEPNSFLSGSLCAGLLGVGRLLFVWRRRQLAVK